MDWLSSLNGAMMYIEENLAGEIDLARAARLACCSPYHLQRMFSYMAGVPLSEYIRRRRMSRAVYDLRCGERVLDVALKYGYDSPTAFNRAFQSVHGVAPTAAKTEGVALKAYPPISFKITIKGEAEMNYRIEKKDAFRIVGVKMTGDSEQGFAQVPSFWAQTAQSGKILQICALTNTEQKGLMGVSTGDWPNAKDFDYYIAAASTAPAPRAWRSTPSPPRPGRFSRAGDRCRALFRSCRSASSPSGCRTAATSTPTPPTSRCTPRATRALRTTSVGCGCPLRRRTRRESCRTHDGQRKGSAEGAPFSLSACRSQKGARLD